MHDAGPTVYFATTNKGKLTSVRRVFAEHGLVLEQLATDIIEPQHDDVGEIAAAKVLKAVEVLATMERVMAVDSALHVPSLNGFPGPFVKQVTMAIGPEGYLRLLEGRSGPERRARFVDAIACVSPLEGPRIFLREVWGTISDHVWDGTGGTGKSAMDKVFIPDGCHKALIAMSADELLAFRSSSGVEKVYHDAARWFLGAQ